MRIVEKEEVFFQAALALQKLLMGLEVELAAGAVHSAHPDAGLVNAEEIPHELAKVDSDLGVEVEGEFVTIPTEVN